MADPGRALVGDHVQSPNHDDMSMMQKPTADEAASSSKRQRMGQEKAAWPMPPFPPQPLQVPSPDSDEVATLKEEQTDGAHRSRAWGTFPECTPMWAD